MSTEKLKGIVLKEYQSGESSKRIVVLTGERGTITLSVKGGKNTKSKYLAATQMFCYSEFVVYEGKGFHSVTSAEVIESFYNLRNDIGKLAYSAYMMELLEKTVFEGMHSEDVLKLTLKTLWVMAKTDIDILLAVSIFEIKYLQMNGFLGEGDKCSSCGNHVGEEIFFSTRDGGIICGKCKSSSDRVFTLLEGTYTAINYVLNSNDSRLFSFKVSKEVLGQLRLILESYIAEHIGQNFYTLEFAKSCITEN
ncbi:MAG: DNA repair protein RecO [Lachnospiraceae bacterium]|nr:DNA repair protein RecO [Lachnospiraceae bacterium]